PLFSIAATPTSAIHTLSLHDALPICVERAVELERFEVAADRPALDRVSPENCLPVGKVAAHGVDDGLPFGFPVLGLHAAAHTNTDRKSTRLNSSHVKISYAVFCLKKK